MGPRACRRLLTAIAKLSRGRAEFLDLAERLQPKVAVGQGGTRVMVVLDTGSHPRSSSSRP